MLSILIPTYNYGCYQLAHDLQQQAARLGVPYEIFVADDGSTDQATLEENRRISDLPNASYVEVRPNHGRAAIRNLLAQKATMEWLLFIDSDAEVRHDDFLQRYLKVLPEADVVCGGISNFKQLPSKEVSLRFIYEHEAEMRHTPRVRSLHPHLHFTTFNFIIRRKLMQRLGFDERCREYGYEDALLGLRLKDEHARILHIDNPLLHKGLDTNEEFLNKTEAALRTLHAIGSPMQDEAHVSRLAHRLKSFGLHWLVGMLFSLFRPTLRRHLLGDNPRFTILQAYKLGYYCAL